MRCGHRILVVGFLLFFAGTTSWLCWHVFFQDVAYGSDVTHSAESKLPFVISKETTYITRPLRPDGTPNYLKALDKRLSQGVTPANNAAVMVWKARGPSLVPKKDRKNFFQALGIPPLSEQGDYYDQHSNEDSFWGLEADSFALHHPWSKKDIPQLARWLELNENPLALFAQAMKCSHYFEPIGIACGEEDDTTPGVPPDSIFQRGDLMYEYMQGGISGTPMFIWTSRTFVQRALLRAHGGKVDEAWDDLLTCHRLAVLANKGPVWGDTMLARGAGFHALIGDQALLEHVELSNQQIARMRKDIAPLYPASSLANKFDLAERFAHLDLATIVARRGFDDLKEGYKYRLENSTDRAKQDEADAALTTIEDAQKIDVDWNVALHTINQGYDKVVKALSEPTRGKRKAALKRFSEDLHTQLTDLKDKSREARSSRIGCAILCCQTWMPYIDAQDCHEMQFELVSLAFALAAYRADHGSYPAKLADLVPKYVDKLPKDIFSEKELLFKTKGNGYLLYSIGVNGKDDGGKTADDSAKANNHEGWDDIAIRITGIDGTKKPIGRP